MSKIVFEKENFKIKCAEKERSEERRVGKECL